MNVQAQTQPGLAALAIASERSPSGVDELGLRVRVRAADGVPTLIYLPGLHGDWTLNTGFRHAVGQQVRLVELTYPRTLTWSLDEYAASIESMLAERGITTGWLLAESFGSQVAWSLLGRGKFRCQGVIFAGGFGEYPVKSGVRMVAMLGRLMPLALLRQVCAIYARLARWRFRQAPDSLADIREFVARRTDLDRQAMIHRLRLIESNDPRSTATRLAVPVFALSGMIDPVVPWPLSRRWFRHHCPSLRAFRVIGQADHNVLNTAPNESARTVVGWMQSSGGQTREGRYPQDTKQTKPKDPT